MTEIPINSPSTRYTGLSVKARWEESAIGTDGDGMSHNDLADQDLSCRCTESLDPGHC